MVATTTFLDIGSSHIKLIEVTEGTFPRLHSFHSFPLDKNHKSEDRLDGLRDQLCQFIAEKDIPVSRLIVVLKDPKLVTHAFYLPSQSWKDVQQKAKAKILDESGLNESSSRIFIESPKIPALQAPKQDFVKATAIASQVIEDALHVVSPLPIKNLSMCCIQDCLVGLANSAHLDHPGATIAIIRISNTTTTLCLCQHGLPVLSRSIPTGGINFTRVLSGELSFDGITINTTNEEAEDIKRFQGITLDEIDPDAPPKVKMPPDVTNELIDPLLDNFSTEIKRFLTFARNELKLEKIDSLFLMGTGAEIKNLDQYFEQVLGIPTKRFSMADQIQIKDPEQLLQFKEEQQEFLHLLGGARNSQKTDFLKKESPFSILKSNLEKYNVLVLFCLLIVCFGLLEAFNQRLQFKANQLEKTWAEKVVNYAHYFRAQNEKRQILGAINDLSTYQSRQIPWAGLFQDIDAAVSESLHLSLLRLETPNDFDTAPSYKLHLEGIASPTEMDRPGKIVSVFLKSLQQSPWILRTDIISLTGIESDPGTDKPGSKHFQIKAILDLPS